MSEQKPSEVSDYYQYWIEAPPEPSPRLLWWLDRFIEGWTPNRRISAMGYDPSAEWYGVYMWEYLCIIWPFQSGQERNTAYSYPEWALQLLDSARDRRSVQVVAS